MHVLVSLRDACHFRVQITFSQLETAPLGALRTVTQPVILAAAVITVFFKSLTTFVFNSQPFVHWPINMITFSVIKEKIVSVYPVSFSVCLMLPSEMDSSKRIIYQNDFFFHPE